MIIAESIGFSATHSFSEILAGLPGTDISHGSKNFAGKTAVGRDDQSIPDFLSSMAEARDQGRKPIALHTLFAPQAMKPACDQAGCTYWLLVREPVRQIESCYAWVSKKVLAGSASSFVQVLNQTLVPLQKMGIESNLPNTLYLFAINHVLSFNFLAVGMGAPVRKMEVLLNNEAAFRDAFDLSDDVPIAHFSGEEVHGVSHRAQKEAGAIADPDRETIQEKYRLNIGERNYSLADMNRLLGY